ncbi:MAG TPA: radical SAM protein [Elusimicrobiales bacterium]|nr:radical SAM protein [Elusimicrobiales bacterium]HPO94452.1 radical SAM protein [Elusimicrobiales bacterium]
MQNEIRKIKIAVTSDCNLRCDHCFINKNNKIVLKKTDFEKAVNLLFFSPGDFKKIEFYGGEPLLYFDKIKDWISIIKNTALKYKKKYGIFIASNGTIITKEILKCIKKENIFIAVSFSGSEKSHGYNRLFENKHNSYFIVKKNIKRFLKNSPSNTFCIYCVDPNFVGNMSADFEEIINLGFKTINIECVCGKSWGEKKFIEFEKEMDEINKKILNLINKKTFIYHEKMYELFSKTHNEQTICPFYQDLELYPDGNFGFYPFSFVNYEKEKKKIIIGDSRRGFNKKYLNCGYDRKECEKCLKKYYYKKNLVDGSIALKIRDKKIADFCKFLIKTSSKNENIKNYIKKAIELNKSMYER